MKGVDTGQEKLLIIRKKTQKDWTEVEKWKDVYRTLFPEDDPLSMLSPCEFGSRHEAIFGD